MDNNHDKMNMGWGRFWGMIATSTAIMFPMMYQLVYQWDHATFSLTRLVSSVVMGCVMVIIMLAFMWPMYRGLGTKIIVLVGAALVGIVLLGVNRNQSLIGDVDFMQSMIPHHSIAINNARRAEFTDPRVRKLADNIIKAQVKEIAQMKMLVADIEAKGSRGDVPLAPRTAELTPELKAEAAAAIH